jgi:hypothetical protein
MQAATGSPAGLNKQVVDLEDIAILLCGAVSSRRRPEALPCRNPGQGNRKM